MENKTTTDQRMEAEAQATRSVKIARQFEKSADQLSLIASAIEHDLCDRRGLKSEWRQIDEHIQSEIKEVWKSIVRQVLMEQSQTLQFDEKAALDEAKTRLNKLAGDSVELSPILARLWTQACRWQHSQDKLALAALKAQAEEARTTTGKIGEDYHKTIIALQRDNLRDRDAKIERLIAFAFEHLDNKTYQEMLDMLVRLR